MEVVSSPTSNSEVAPSSTTDPEIMHKLLVILLQTGHQKDAFILRRTCMPSHPEFVRLCATHDERTGQRIWMSQNEHAWIFRDLERWSVKDRLQLLENPGSALGGLLAEYRYVANEGACDARFAAGATQDQLHLPLTRYIIAVVLQSGTTDGSDLAQIDALTDAFYGSTFMHGGDAMARYILRLGGCEDFTQRVRSMLESAAPDIKCTNWSWLGKEHKMFKLDEWFDRTNVLDQGFGKACDLFVHKIVPLSQMGRLQSPYTDSECGKYLLLLLRTVCHVSTQPKQVRSRYAEVAETWWQSKVPADVLVAHLPEEPVVTRRAAGLMYAFYLLEQTPAGDADQLRSTGVERDDDDYADPKMPPAGMLGEIMRRLLHATRMRVTRFAYPEGTVNTFGRFWKQTEAFEECTVDKSQMLVQFADVLKQLAHAMEQPEPLTTTAHIIEKLSCRNKWVNTKEPAFASLVAYLLALRADACLSTQLAAFLGDDVGNGGDGDGHVWSGQVTTSCNKTPDVHRGLRVAIDCFFKKRNQEHDKFATSLKALMVGGDTGDGRLPTEALPPCRYPAKSNTLTAFKMAFRTFGSDESYLAVVLELSIRFVAGAAVCAHRRHRYGHATPLAWLALRQLPDTLKTKIWNDNGSLCMAPIALRTKMPVDLPADLPADPAADLPADPAADPVPGQKRPRQQRTPKVRGPPTPWVKYVLTRLFKADLVRTTSSTSFSSGNVTWTYSRSTLTTGSQTRCYTLRRYDGEAGGALGHMKQVEVLTTRLARISKLSGHQLRLRADIMRIEFTHVCDCTYELRGMDSRMVGESILDLNELWPCFSAFPEQYFTADECKNVVVATRTATLTRFKEWHKNSDDIQAKIDNDGYVKRHNAVFDALITAICGYKREMEAHKKQFEATLG